MKKNSWAERGLTLIEILIALMVMIIGLVGVLALFPTAIRSMNESVEDRMAAVVAESVAHALATAMRSATAENRAAGTPAKVTLHHDGLPENGTTYHFTLPLPEDPRDCWPSRQPRFFGHPDGSGPEPTKPFMLGSESYLKDVFANVIKGPDKTDPYTQYGFTIKACRVDDARSKDQTGPTKYKPLPLYEFRIAVYRIASKGTTDDYYTGTKGLPEPIKVFVIQISGQ